MPIPLWPGQAIRNGSEAFPTRSLAMPVVNVLGLDIKSLDGQRFLKEIRQDVQRFYAANNTYQQMSGLPFWKTQVRRDGYTLAYRSNYGQEIVTIERIPQTPIPTFTPPPVQPPHRWLAYEYTWDGANYGTTVFPEDVSEVYAGLPEPFYPGYLNRANGWHQTSGHRLITRTVFQQERRSGDAVGMLDAGYLYAIGNTFGPPEELPVLMYVTYGPFSNVAREELDPNQIQNTYRLYPNPAPKGIITVVVDIHEFLRQCGPVVMLDHRVAWAAFQRYMKLEERGYTPAADYAAILAFEPETYPTESDRALLLDTVQGVVWNIGWDVGSPQREHYNFAHPGVLPPHQFPFPPITTPPRDVRLRVSVADGNQSLAALSEYLNTFYVIRGDPRNVTFPAAEAPVNIVTKDVAVQEVSAQLPDVTDEGPFEYSFGQSRYVIAEDTVFFENATGEGSIPYVGIDSAGKPRIEKYIPKVELDINEVLKL